MRKWKERENGKRIKNRKKIRKSRERERKWQKNEKMERK